MTIAREHEAFIIGVLAVAGSFGGDGKQPQVTLRMHVRHEGLLRWMTEVVAGSKLHGPYKHGERNYFQWSVRGKPLATVLLPMLQQHLHRSRDVYVYGRFQAMRERYAAQIERHQLAQRAVSGESV